MDTNTEPQINSFAGGLNSDDDLSVVATNQYIDARNIKISSYRGGEGSLGCKISWIICWREQQSCCHWFNKRLRSSCLH